MAKQVQKQKVAAGEAAISAVKLPREKQVRERLAEVKNNIESGDLEMAELLSEAYHKEFHVGWGFATFEDYCKDELDVNYRKAMYFIDIWDKVKSLDLPKARVAKLGWTKMKEIATVITKKNAEKLLKQAESMTSRELQESVKTLRKAKGTDREMAVTVRLGFMLSEAEHRVVLDALSEAKKILETDNGNLALESICAEWMEFKGAQPEAASLEDIIEYLETVYPVKLTFKTVGKKKTSETKKEAKEVLKETEKVTEKATPKGSKKKAAKASDPDPDALGGDEAGDGDLDIDELINNK